MKIVIRPTYGHTDVDRLASISHYIIARTEPAELGATKLNKILWYSDLEFYRQTGESITTAQAYVRLPHGPAPHMIEDALNILKRENKILERKSKVFSYDRREFVWLEDAATSSFTPQQLDIVASYIDRIKRLTADEISKITHKDSMWRRLNNGDPMAIGACAIISRPPTESELEWAQGQSVDAA